MAKKSNAQFHALVGRALQDEGFRKRLVDPATMDAALEEVGVKPTPKIRKAIKASHDAILNLHGSFDQPVEAA